MYPPCVPLVCLLALLVFPVHVQAEENHSLDFSVAIGFDNSDEQSGRCTSVEKNDIQREVRYFIRKRAQAYSHFDVSLKEDIRLDQDYTQKKNDDVQVGRRQDRRVRQVIFVNYPWGGSGQLECINCKQGKSGLRKLAGDADALDAIDFETHMSTNLTEDMQWAVVALQKRKKLSLDCLGQGDSLTVSFELN